MGFRLLTRCLDRDNPQVFTVMSNESYFRDVDFTVDAILLVGRYTSILRNNMAALRYLFAEPISECLKGHRAKVGPVLRTHGHGLVFPLPVTGDQQERDPL